MKFKLSIGQVFIILGVLSALMVFLIFKSVMGVTKNPENQLAHQQGRAIIVANRYLTPGDVVQYGDVRVVQWPANFFPQQEVMQTPEEAVGKAVKIDVFPGQPVYRLNLTAMDSQGGLPLVIPRGYRAISIEMSEVKGVGGLLKPGDHVDVIGTFDYTVSPYTADASNPQEVRVAQTVLQDAQVLAVAQDFVQVSEQQKRDVERDFQTRSSREANAKKSPEDYAASKSSKSSDSYNKMRMASSVTLAVTPEQAQVIALAEEQGELKLVLRPEEDHRFSQLPGSAEIDMLSDTAVFQKAMEFLMLRNVGGSTNTAAPPVANTRMYASTGVTAAPMSSAAPSAMPSSSSAGASSGEHHVQVIEGTQVNDVYVTKRK